MTRNLQGLSTPYCDGG